MNPNRTAIFLGAGASKADGVPLQNELFRDYFSLRKSEKDKFGDLNLESFFEFMFGINMYGEVPKKVIKNIQFPSFEECIGMLDISMLKDESFRGFDIEVHAPPRLRQIREELIDLMTVVITIKSKKQITFHQKLINKFDKMGLLQEISFVSTNYDLLIDNALTYVNNSQEKMLDYGIEFENFKDNHGWRKPNEKSVKLFKLHGSLNWLYCPVCNHITYTPLKEGVVLNLINPGESCCKHCEQMHDRIIVPPSFFKKNVNPFLAIVWLKAETVLREIDHLIFCGYSFPDADLHVKYLLKRIQTNRNKELPLKITVVNNHKGKPKEQKRLEKERYLRFLGKSVDYTECSFESFAEHPTDILNVKT